MEHEFLGGVPGAVRVVGVDLVVLFTHYPEGRTVSPDAGRTLVPCGDEAVQIVHCLPSIGVGNASANGEGVYLFGNRTLGGDSDGVDAGTETRLVVVRVAVPVGIRYAVHLKGAAVGGCGRVISKGLLSSNGVAAVGGAQKFPSAASLSIWLSRVSSATARFSLLFLVSSCFRRRA